jgi:hypothetical protein
MCTLSWIPGRDGHVLLVNRDERRARPRALPPSVEMIEGVSVLAPIDPEGGGTWVAVNSGGVTLALANRYHDTVAAGRSHRVSRGRLVLALASSTGIEEIENRLAGERLERFDGFTLVALEPGVPARLFAWDGRSLAIEDRSEPGLLVASSAANEAAAVAARELVFRSLPAAEGWTRRALCRAHQSHEPAQGPLSICMHRDEASTVSLTHIEIDPERVTMIYHDGQPCTAPPATTASLARVTAAIGG